MVICKRGCIVFEFMSLEKIHFIGLLTNVDSSIVNIPLKHGFNIKSFSENEGCEFFSNLESLPKIEVGRRLFIEYPCLNHIEKKIYYISNSIENIETGIEQPIIFSPKIMEFDIKLVHGYLSTRLRLMRLFKEGNICMPFYYYYYRIHNDKPIRLMGHETNRSITREAFTVNDIEISDMKRFVETIEIPFKKPFLQLAFENFELSYQIQERQLSFLSLMMSLETLFHPSDHGELQYRISRNVAVLLGKKDNKASKTIFAEVKELYDKRSRLVHTGNKNIVKENDLLQLRLYVRESIKEINSIGKDKDDLLDLLNSRGFS